MSAEWFRYAARALALTWGGWWTFFGLASGIGERLSPPGILIHTLLPGGVFLGSALCAWRWERPGAVLLLLEAMAAAAYAGVGRTHSSFLLLTLALPPFLVLQRRFVPVQPSKSRLVQARTVVVILAGLLLLSASQRSAAQS